MNSIDAAAVRRAEISMETIASADHRTLMGPWVGAVITLDLATTRLCSAACGTGMQVSLEEPIDRIVSSEKYHEQLGSLRHSIVLKTRKEKC